MILLAKVMELRGQRRHGLKTREEYERIKQDFVATRNPGQRSPQTDPQPATETTDTMGDTNIKIFYGDYSRNYEEPTTWMQNLNTRRVANDWTDAKTIGVFESLLAEEKKAYRWWHEDLKTTNPSMDRANWA